RPPAAILQLMHESVSGRLEQHGGSREAKHVRPLATLGAGERVVVDAGHAARRATTWAGRRGRPAQPRAAAAAHEAGRVAGRDQPVTAEADGCEDEVQERMKYPHAPICRVRRSRAMAGRRGYMSSRAVRMMSIGGSPPNHRLNAVAPCAISISVPSAAVMPKRRACRTNGVAPPRR